MEQEKENRDLAIDGDEEEEEQGDKSRIYNSSLAYGNQQKSKK